MGVRRARAHLWRRQCSREDAFVVAGLSGARCNARGATVAATLTSALTSALPAAVRPARKPTLAAACQPATASAPATAPTAASGAVPPPSTPPLTPPPPPPPPPLVPPPTPTAPPPPLLALLESRFADGAPSNTLADAGVLLRQFDSLSGLDRHQSWLPCPQDIWCANFHAQWPASIVNCNYRHLYYGDVGGLVLDPQLVQLFCV